MNTLTVNFPVVKVAISAPGHSQKRELSPGSAGCQCKDQKFKYVKSVSCVTQLSCVKPVTCVKNVVSNLPVGARLQNFWKTWLKLGAGPKVVQILKEGYTLLFRIRPRLTRSPTVISCYVNPHWNLYLLEALHQLIDKNAVALVQNQTFKNILVFRGLYGHKRVTFELCHSALEQSMELVLYKSHYYYYYLWVFSTIFSPTAQQQVEAHIRSDQTEPFPQGREVQSGDTRNHQDMPLTRGVGHLRVQGRLLPYSNTGTVQEISEISCPRSDIPVQSSAFRFVHSTLGVHCSSKGGETDGHTQGYKDPPVPRRLVGEGQIPPGLSPAYSGSSENMPRTGAQADF